MKYKHDKYSFLDRITVDGILDTVLFITILLFVIVGCKQPTINKVQQAVEAQAKLLVDSGLIANEYVVLYELKKWTVKEKGGA